MKVSTTFAATMALMQSASAHYIFQQLTVGSTKYPVFQYIRQNSNYNSPVTGMSLVLSDWEHNMLTVLWYRPRLERPAM
jgi:hypothetical protein